MSEIGVAVLGSTGTVGCNTLEVLALHPDRFRVFALAARGNADLDFFLPFEDAFPAAIIAGCLRYRTFAVAGRTETRGGEIAEKGIACLTQFSFAVAGFAGRHLRTGFGHELPD